MINKFESIGFKDMHPMQVEALTELVAIALNLASLADDNEIFEETAAYCDELVKLFGGSGVSMSVDIRPLGLPHSLRDLRICRLVRRVVAQQRRVNGALLLRSKTRWWGELKLRRGSGHLDLWKTPWCLLLRPLDALFKSASTLRNSLGANLPNDFPSHLKSAPNLVVVYALTWANTCGPRDHVKKGFCAQKLGHCLEVLQDG
jgi:hypothetical protein